MLEALKQLFPDPAFNEEDFENYKKARGLYIEDPWERVKCIFQFDEFKNLHPELKRAIQIAQLGLVLGGGAGAINESAKYSREFIRTNDARVYMSKHDLYKTLTNKSLEGMAKGALKWGPKIGLFVGGFSLVSSCCEAYRNKSGIIEYVVGGYVAGGISRSALGIKGFVAGGILGAVLGLIMGTFRVGLEKLTKTDTLVLKYSHYAYKKHREQLYEKMKTPSHVSSSEQLVSSIHGEHRPNPLNDLDAKNQEL